MKIVCQIHLFPPTHNAGAELMLFYILRYLQSRRHEAKVIVDYSKGNWDYKGVKCFGSPSEEEQKRIWQWADIGMTHLDSTTRAINNARGNRKPIFHLIHNDWTAQTLPRNHSYIFNSEHIMKKCGGNIRSKMVVHPPVFVSDYRVNARNAKAVTLINLWNDKGAMTFYECARRLPHIPFYGVKGCYGQQVISTLGTPNVRILDHTSDIRRIYEQTKILLMPSRYESYGRTGLEAACSGIPTIAAFTDGLKESLGPHALFADPKVTDAYVDEITRLFSNADYYKYRSNQYYKRAFEVQSKSYRELNELDKFLNQFVKKKAA